MRGVTDVQMYTTDIASIAAASTHTTESDVAMDVSDVEVVAVQLKSTGGDASISGNLVARLVASLDGTNYDTQTYAAVTLIQTTNSEERATELVNVQGIRYLKVKEIENQDASYAATNVNVIISKKIV